MRLKDLDIDDGIVEIFEKNGITELYPPQEEALKHVLAGDSTVLAVPTASGKSLVAYIAVVRAALSGQRAFYIVPLRALASEKYADLKEFESLGIRVGKTVGDYDAPETELKNLDIIVVTSERADSLLRHRSSWMEEIGVIVADEIHLINDANRGPTLEVTLVRLRELNPNTQVIALSATIKNSIELAEWLEAKHLQSDWRPVELKEGVFFEDHIEFVDGSSRNIVVKGEGIPSLALDTIKDSGQILIFVNTRRSSMSVAEKVGKVLIKSMGEEEVLGLDALAVRLEKCEEELTSLGNRLARCIRNGAAFHNAGLTDSQRALIEHGFRERRIKCIVATPTLAAGINLPARRVVVRDTTRFDANYGNVRIPVLEVKQMCGRAGRPQYDPYGEAVLIARKPRDLQELKEHYLLGEPESIRSKLGSEPALRIHTLATIATGYARDRGELMDFIDRSFFAHQMDVWTIEDMIDKMLEFLDEVELITAEDDGFRATMFGRRTSALYIDPLSAVILREAVERSESTETNALCLLHACCTTPDMPLFYLRKKDHDWVDELAVENNDRFLVARPDDEGEEMAYFLSALKTASLIEHWINEAPENNIVEKFGVGPGDIRSRVDKGEWLLYSMREIARLFASPIVGTLNPLVLRIRYGIKEELVPLAELRNIGRKRARSLYSAGFRTLEDISRASEKELETLPSIGKRIAHDLKEQVHRRG